LVQSQTQVDLVERLRPRRECDLFEVLVETTVPQTYEVEYPHQLTGDEHIRVSRFAQTLDDSMR